MKTFKTPKGTELPIMDLRGKDYLEVKWRIVWFREERPLWRISTTVTITDNSCLAKAHIMDEHANIMTTSHKFETKEGFPDFIEKSETGAIGRALALLGFGTQFCADEMEEGSRIVDSPVAPKIIPHAPKNIPHPPLPQGKLIAQGTLIGTPKEGQHTGPHRWAVDKYDTSLMYCTKNPYCGLKLRPESKQ